MKFTDEYMRMHVMMRPRSRKEAEKLAKRYDAVLIQIRRGKQWAVVLASRTATGNQLVAESMKRFKESTTDLGSPKPKVVADYRK